MSNRHARILVAGCTAVLAVTLGATPALATTTWAIQPGGAITAKSGKIALKDTKTGSVLPCPSSAGAASDGKVRFTYADSTGRLTVLATSGNLHFWNVSAGCLGLVNSGDRATLGATFAMSPKQAITSP